MHALSEVVYDARRLIMYHKEAVEKYPLQVYASALLFSPADSLIRRLFQHEEPRGVSIKPQISNGWNACLQTLEGHSGSVSSVTFSHDSARLASASDDRTLKIWDAYSHISWVNSGAFSHDLARLASASDDRTVKIWDAYSGACLQTLEGQSSSDLPSILATLLCNEDIDESQQSLHHDSNISVDTIWLSINSQKILWLPSEYRPNCSAASDKFIGVGTGHGKVWIGRVK
jgi:WD40 repeat protein